ncbi:hypothetical protein IE81DRAFT_326548 [Ceraceosorus guamensis]|uniref:GATOR1 complex protein NPRL3 C-terminal HTH domain-containing protein n=1 Tax=Ceraceosorus guamensis TaxID=1522189 RepID=A0A316VPE4_9BASI|nr:hypothetical protein IE81DRAFT_326548 [Ceraceosorus guamensis]PWN39446.1 hypothetical protein IE81DRAFT_326548 [Ceraceosorus guamensis]
MVRRTSPSHPANPSLVLAVLLTVESSRGSNLVFRWPPNPSLSKRHSQVRYYRTNDDAGPASGDLLDRQQRPDAQSAAQRKQVSSSTSRGRAGRGEERSKQSGAGDVRGTLSSKDSRSAQQREDAREKAMREEAGSASDTSASSSAMDSQGHSDGDISFDSEEWLPSLRSRTSSTGAGNSTVDKRAKEPHDGIGAESAVDADSDSASVDGLGAAARGSARDSRTRRRVPSSSAIPAPSSSPRQGPARSSSRARGHGGASGPLRDVLAPASAASSRERAEDRAVQRAKRQARAYTTYLGYQEVFLASLLSPHRDACHARFELTVDDVAFVGHPVCADASANWGDVPDDAIQRPAGHPPPQPHSPARGRAPRAEEEMPAAEGAAREVASQEHAQTSEDFGSESCLPSDSKRERDAASTLSSQVNSYAVSSGQHRSGITAFHLVLVLDRPDPSADMPQLDTSTWSAMFHDAVCFKLTAALWAEQVRCGYVASESEHLLSLKETCRDRGDTFNSYVSSALRSSSLARLLRSLYSSLSRGENAFVSVNDNIEAHLQLPPLLRSHGAKLSRLREVETCLDPNDHLLAAGAGGRWGGSGDAWDEASRATGPLLLPWKTLLLSESAGLGRVPASSDDESDSPVMRGDGIEGWAKRFTAYLKPTLAGVPTFGELADLLAWDLYDDVFPMVRHLIYYRDARVVDVPRIHSMYAISPLFYLRSLPRLSTSWHRAFPDEPSLPAFLSTFSASLRPFAVNFGRNQRQTAFDALVWLLRHDVIVQMHARLRLVATEEIKRDAARRRAALRHARAAKRQQNGFQRARETTQASDGTFLAGVNSFQKAAAPIGGAPAQSGMAQVLARGNAYHRGDEVQADPEPANSTQPMGEDVTVQPKGRTGSVSSRVESSRTTSLSPLTSFSALKESSTASARYIDELRFERRRIPRSRSPSRAIGLVGDDVRTQLSVSSEASSSAVPAMKTVANTSRPNTPRGRALSIRQEHLHSDAFTPNSSSSLGNVDNATRVASRSPSRARMRITGFGQDEEVQIDDAAGSQETGASMQKSGGNGKGGGPLQVPFQYLNRAGDEARRLSLVGEESSTRGSPALERNIGGSLTVEPSVATSREQLDSLAPDQGASRHEEDYDRSSPRGSEANDSLESEESESQHSLDFEQWESDPMPSIIPEPGRASAEENEWIESMLNRQQEEWIVEWFRKLLPYMNGRHTIDEIVYREEMRRRELKAVLAAFKDEMIHFVHP